MKWGIGEEAFLLQWSGWSYFVHGATVEPTAPVTAGEHSYNSDLHQHRLAYVRTGHNAMGSRIRPCPKRRLRLQLRLDRARLLFFNTGRRADLDVAVAEVVVSDTA